MKGKKLMAMLMAGSLLLAGLTGCGGATAKGGGAAASADDYPNGPVTIICPWGRTWGRSRRRRCRCHLPQDLGGGQELF